MGNRTLGLLALGLGGLALVLVLTTRPEEKTAAPPESRPQPGAKQQAQLDYLTKRNVNHDYENRARYELDTNDINDDPFDSIFDFEDDDDDDDELDEETKSIAFAHPIVIELE